LRGRKKNGSRLGKGEKRRLERELGV